MAERVRASRDQARPDSPLADGTPRPGREYRSEQIVRAVGNRAMGRLLRRDHPDEAAAHALATTIMGAPTPAEATFSASVPGGLDAVTRAYFEPRFGVDLGQVRIHSGPEAARSTAELGTVAYTVGPHIVLGESHQAGPNLVTAHELAHVVRGDAVGRICRAPEPPKYPPPTPGQTPFNFISEGPALLNWQISVTEVLGREFKEKFGSYNAAIQRFREHLATLPKAEAEDFADRMRDRVRKAFYRREYRKPSYTYDADEMARLKGGRSPSDTAQLEHLQDVKTKVRNGRVVEGRPDLALDPGNIYVTEGGKGGTAPKGSLHAEKYRTIGAATKRSEEIRRGTTPSGATPPAPKAGVEPPPTPAAVPEPVATPAAAPKPAAAPEPAAVPHAQPSVPEKIPVPGAGLPSAAEQPHPVPPVEVHPVPSAPVPAAPVRVTAGMRVRAGLKAGGMAVATAIAFMGLDYLVHRQLQKDLEESIEQCKAGMRRPAERFKAKHPDQPVYMTVTIGSEEYSRYVPFLGWMPEAPVLHLLSVGYPTAEVIEEPVVRTDDHSFDMFRPGKTVEITYSELLIP